jgi:hypothetical protein
LLFRPSSFARPAKTLPIQPRACLRPSGSASRRGASRHASTRALPSAPNHGSVPINVKHRGTLMHTRDLAAKQPNPHREPLHTAAGSNHLSTVGFRGVANKACRTCPYECPWVEERFLKSLHPSFPRQP